MLWRTPTVQPRPVVRWSYMQKDYFGLPALSRDGTRLAFAQAEGNTFHIVLRMMDQTELKPLPGGELYVRYGKGVYIFSAYSWFRQLPAGVPGAFRLFANMLSAAKTQK